MEEARVVNPYAIKKDLGDDYRFWNVSHSNFYAIAILGARKSKIVKMQYLNGMTFRRRNNMILTKW